MKRIEIRTDLAWSEFALWPREVAVNPPFFGRSGQWSGGIAGYDYNLNAIVYFTYQTQGLCAVHMWRGIEISRKTACS